MKNLKDLFTHEIKDLHSAEKQILAALPKLARASNSEELTSAFEAHLEETEDHVARLDKILEELGTTARGVKCKGMEGLVAEGEEVLEEDPSDEVVDAALIGAAQRVEHYEIAGYGTALAHAEQLGMKAAAKLLQKTLDEENAANAKLTMIAENGANELAESNGTKAGTGAKAGSGSKAASGAKTGSGAKATSGSRNR